jgi:hypothetical protein
VANNLAGANPRRGGLLIDLGLWNHPLCDTDTVVGGEFFLPIGPWPKGEELRPNVTFSDLNYLSTFLPTLTIAIAILKSSP